MLIHPSDAALAPAEWQGWLASTDRFRMLAVINLDNRSLDKKDSDIQQREVGGGWIQ